jgi:hypothetical protein
MKVVIILSIHFVLSLELVEAVVALSGGKVLRCALTKKSG